MEHTVNKTLNLCYYSAAKFVSKPLFITLNFARKDCKVFLGTSCIGRRLPGIQKVSVIMSEWSQFRINFSYYCRVIKNPFLNKTKPKFMLHNQLKAEKSDFCVQPRQDLGKSVTKNLETACTKKK